MMSASWGRIDIVKALLAKGVDVNARNNADRTALTLAGKHEKILVLLKSQGASG